MGWAILDRADTLYSGFAGFTLARHRQNIEERLCRSICTEVNDAPLPMDEPENVNRLHSDEMARSAPGLSRGHPRQFLFRNAWLSLLLFHFAIIVSILIAKPDTSLKILLTSRSLKWSLLTMILCGSTGITLYFFWDKFGIASNVSADVEAMGLSSSNWIPFIAYFTLVNPFVEEYFWRAFWAANRRTSLLPIFCMPVFTD